MLRSSSFTVMVRPCLVRTVSRLRSGSFWNLTSRISSALTLCAMRPDLAQTVRMSSSNLTVAALFRLNRWSSGAVLLDWRLAGSWLLFPRISPAEELGKLSPPAGGLYVFRVGELILGRFLDGDPDAGYSVLLPGVAAKLWSAPQVSNDI